MIREKDRKNNVERKRWNERMRLRGGALHSFT